MIRKLINVTLAIGLALVLFTLAKLPQKHFSIVNDVAPHVVPYRILSKGNKRYATGFHLKYEGKTYIVTNKHVCDSNLKVYGHGNIQFGSYVGKIIAIDDQHDLCLVTSNRNQGLSLANKQAKPMEKVYVVGFPRGLGKTIREGRIVGNLPIFAPWLGAPGGPIPYVDTIQVSAIAYGGNSGSPIINELGKVTGVLFAGHRYYHTETYIVPLSYLKTFLLLNAK